MGRDEQNETRALDPGLAAQLAGPALPFAGPAGIGFLALDPPAGAGAVPISFGVVPWRAGGPLRLTVVVKASFAMLGGPPMPPAPAADPFRVGDALHRNQPLGHVIGAADRVPWKGAIDVTLLGSAQAPGGRALPEMRARLALRQGGKVALDKSVRVVGERSAPGAVPAPFTTMPIVYTRAHGGLGALENPIGCSDDDDEQPNILDPESPRRTAGFGPLAAAWPLRSKRLGERGRRFLDAPILEIPAGFDWGYFQSAPPDQQLGELSPDAALLLEGLHAERPRLELTLPGARAVGAVYGVDEASPEAPTALLFRADTLHLDTDRWLATLTFRACIDLRDEASLGRVLVAAGVGLGGRDPLVPARSPQSAAPVTRMAAAGVGTAKSAATGTLALGDEGEGRGATLPFGARDDAGSQTMVLTDAPAAQAVPFVAEAPAMQAAPFVAGAPASLFVAEAAPAPLAPPPPEGPARRASDFFHAPARLRELAPAVAPAAAPAPVKALPPEEQVDLDRYARLRAALTAPRETLDALLDREAIDAAVWRKAELYWTKALEQEAKRGKPVLRDRFDDAYVDAWERAQPGRFELWHYACIKQAETDGQLHNELADQGLDAALGMRLRRVWRRRIAADRALAEELERSLAVVRER